MNRLDASEGGITTTQLAEFVALGWRLAGQMAEANFRSITAAPAWTMADAEAETDRAIERMEIASHDMLTGKGADPDGANWREIWTAMEAGYRETMAGLLRASGRRGGGTLQ